VVSLAEPAEARRRLGATLLPVGPRPVHRIVRQEPVPEPEWTTFLAFCRELEEQRPVDRICAEHTQPEELAARLPHLDQLDVGEAADGWLAGFFMAGPGATTHLHVDRDLRHDLVYQLFGRKRYVVIDADESAKLTMGIPSEAGYASALFLDHFDDRELAAFLRYTGARECVLQPGETLLIPATAWHYVEYLDVAASIHFRLGRLAPVRALAELAADLRTFNVEFLSLAHHFLDGTVAADVAGSALARLRRAARHPRRSQRIPAFTRACLLLCEELQLPAARPPVHVADVARRVSLRGRSRHQLSPRTKAG
jgi:hypothetical protein